MTTIHTFLLIAHVLVGAMMIALILLQRGKGAETGAAFGSGASATVFGAKGSANFLSRSTAILAALFFGTSLWLTYLGGERPVARSVVEQQQPVEPALKPGKDDKTAAPAPQGPAAPPAGNSPAGGAPATGTNQ